ncbi:hypothetical protein HY214_04240 [Candidatus Roizmanbacteria bacterium]|nr:hypothetical protein [Candidatus Roizmanbacteria bacterium]
MRIIGVLLIAIGLALLLFVGYAFLKQNNRLLTPVPEEQGVKVIFVTPSPLP